MPSQPSDAGSVTQVPKMGCKGGVAFKAINANDDLLGTCSLQRRSPTGAIQVGFIYSGGVYKEFSQAMAILTIPTAFTNEGKVVGYYQPVKSRNPGTPIPG